MFLFCNEDKKKKERLNSVLKTTHNLIKKNDIKDVRKNPVYSLIRAMSNYHLYDIVRELYEDEEVTDVQSIYKDIGEHLINSDKLNNSKSFELGESNINIDLSKDAILVCAWNKERFVNALLNIGQNVGNLFEYDKINHMATYIYPIGLTIVYNGNHSTLSGILKGEGTIQANQTYFAPSSRSIIAVSILVYSICKSLMASDVGRVSGVQFGVVNAFCISSNCRYRALTVCTSGYIVSFLPTTQMRL